MSDQQACQTPIIDLLRDIPADARMVYEVTSTHHQSIPVGVLAKQAADEIKRLTAERNELRRQLAEAEQDAQRYRWIAGHCRSTSEQWGGRWSIVVEGPCPAKHDEEDAFDDAIDAAIGFTRPSEE